MAKLVRRETRQIGPGGLRAARNGVPQAGAHPRPEREGVALSYARIFLAVIILIAVLFFLLKVAIVGGIFGVFALIVLAIVIKEGL